MIDTENPNPEDEKKSDTGIDAEAENEGDDEDEDESGKTEAGDLGRAEVEVGEEFYATMSRFGASVAQVKEILKSWKHLKGKGLLAAFKQFASRKARASAHAEVEIEKGKDYGLLQNVLNHFKSLRNAPEQEQTQKHQADARNRPQGPGSQGPSM